MYFLLNNLLLYIIPQNFNFLKFTGWRGVAALGFCFAFCKRCGDVVRRGFAQRGSGICGSHYRTNTRARSKHRRTTGATVLFLKFSRRQHTTRGHASQARIRTKSTKTGPVLTEKAIETKRPALIVGAHNAGKTRMISRIYDEAKHLWLKRDTFIYWSALQPAASMLPEGLSDWAVSSGIDFEKLPVYKRFDLIPEYIKKTGAVLFIDDAHKLAGRKLDIVKTAIFSTKIWIISASDENKISPSLRPHLLSQNPQIIRLKTDTSYDITTYFLWILVAILATAGAPEIAAVIAGMRILSNGNRATRNS
jgi:hypothetical protein